MMNLQLLEEMKSRLSIKLVQEDEKHLENMKHAAEEVRTCLSHTQYGGQPCLVLRGKGKKENFVLDDLGTWILILLPDTEDISS